MIALTANVMSHQVAAYHEAGFDGLVPKPIDLQQLLEVMSALEAYSQSDAGSTRAA
jgi:CheY-like chemotaxis protein